jgi:sugar/nucleoside kinase (ribokinase family)
MDYVTFGIVIDEIVQADGTSSPGHLGGGGAQTAFGVRLWTEPGHVGIVARVGADMPAAAWRWLEESGIDTAGVTVTGYPTLRARQALDAAGRRRHEWQVPGEVIGAQLARSIESLSEGYRHARGWHLGVHPEEADLGFLRSLRELGGRVSVETFRPAQSRLAPPALHALLSAADIFSPNVLSAESLVGGNSPEAFIERLLAAGAGVVALRRGAEGSLVAEAGSGWAAFIPAARTTVVDVVGAGNAYCGGFLTGWVETGDIVEAGLRGAAAASLLLEEVGVPVVSDARRVVARRRVEEMRSGVRRIKLG